MNTKLKITILFIASLLINTTAMAHIGAETHGSLGFFSGFMHPIGGMDHMLTMLSVGLWSALTARRAGYELLWGPMGFACLLLVGALVGVHGIAVPAVEPMIAVSLLVTGLLVITRFHTPGFLAALIVGVFAIFHGLAHGYELASRASAIQTLTGMLVATVLLHITGLVLGRGLRHVDVWVSRLAGSAVALFGGVLLLQLT
jgi:urease accessory protein